jgi:hypothetical protein
MNTVALLSTVALASAALTLTDQMEGQAFGWQFAIAQNGQLKVTDSDGTAVATMKLLRRNSLNVESLVWPMRKYIFQPAGISNVGCIAPGTTTGVRSYHLTATQSSW